MRPKKLKLKIKNLVLLVPLFKRWNRIKIKELIKLKYHKAVNPPSDPTFNLRLPFGLFHSLPMWLRNLDITNIDFVEKVRGFPNERMYVVYYIFTGRKLEIILKVTTLFPNVLRVFSSVLQKNPGNTSEKV